jgi:hypothetical protein
LCLRESKMKKNSMKEFNERIERMEGMERRKEKA